MASKSTTQLEAKITADITDFVKKLDDLNKQASSKFKGLEKKTGESGKQAGLSFSQGFTNAVEKGFSGMESLALKWGKRSAIAFAGGIVGITKITADFEKQMLAVKASMPDLGGDEFVKLTEKVRQVGKETVYSARESASAVEMLAKNGLNYTEVMNGALDATVALSAATGSDLVMSADVATSVIKIFGEDAKKSVNGITGALVNSRYDLQDYNLFLSQGGGIAKSYGVSLDEMNTVLGMSAKMFGSGSDAGTSFKTFLSNLIPTTDAQVALFQEMNLEFFDANGNMKDMVDIIGELEDGFAGLSTEERVYAMNTIFGSDASRMANQLLQEGTKGYNDMALAISKVNAEQMAQTRMGGFAGAWENFKGTLEDISIELGQKLLPSLTAGLKNMSEWISDNSEEISDFGDVVIDFVENAGSKFIDVFKWVIDHKDGVVTALKLIAVTLAPLYAMSKINQLSRGLGGLVGMAGATGGGAMATGGAFGGMALLNPVTMGVIATGLLDQLGKKLTGESFVGWMAGGLNIVDSKEDKERKKYASKLQDFGFDKETTDLMTKKRGMKDYQLADMPAFEKAFAKNQGLQSLYDWATNVQGINFGGIEGFQLDFMAFIGGDKESVFAQLLPKFQQFQTDAETFATSMQSIGEALAPGDLKTSVTAKLGDYMGMVTSGLGPLQQGADTLPDIKEGLKDYENFNTIFQQLKDGVISLDTTAFKKMFSPEMISEIQTAQGTINQTAIDLNTFVTAQKALIEQTSDPEAKKSLEKAMSLKVGDYMKRIADLSDDFTKTFDSFDKMRQSSEENLKSFSENLPTLIKTADVGAKQLTEVYKTEQEKTLLYTDEWIKKMNLKYSGLSGTVTVNYGFKASEVSFSDMSQGNAPLFSATAYLSTNVASLEKS